MHGHKHSLEAKRKISLANLGNKKRLGKTHSEETKQKISKHFKGKPVKFNPVKIIVKCPHCEVSSNLRIMKRWHFNKCKNIKNST